MTVEAELPTPAELGALAPTRRWRRYPAYKDSGIPWLSAIPAHWEIAPLYARYTVQLGKMLNPNATQGAAPAPYLRNVNVQWDRVDLADLQEMDFSPDERRKFSLRVGDLLVCEGGEVGRTAIWRGELAECFFQKAVHRVRPASPQEQPRFLYYLLFAAAHRGVFEAEGNRSTIVHLTAEKLRRHRLPFPNAEDQCRTVAFLDRETAKIDALVEKKRRLLALIEEKRAALISHAVTRGLDPSVPMKESGIAWLGQVPAHWEVKRLKYAARLESGHTPSRSVPEYWEDCTIPWVSLVDVVQIRRNGVDVIQDTAEKISELGLANSSARLLPAGTVILSRTASVGFSAILGRPMATTQDFANWVCGPQLMPDYLLQVLRSMTSEYCRLTMGSTHQTIYMPDIARFVIPVPPIEEQQDIVHHIKGHARRLDVLAEKVRRHVELLGEYRTALIAAAVTGKIDVRQA